LIFKKEPSKQLKLFIFVKNFGNLIEVEDGEKNMCSCEAEDPAGELARRGG
jgi:hypothetical protein